MTSQQDTELSMEELVKSAYEYGYERAKKGLTKGDGYLKDYKQALTSWKDKEVELERQNRIKTNKSFCGCPMCSHHTEPYVESLQSQGGK